MWNFFFLLEHQFSLLYGRFLLCYIDDYRFFRRMPIYRRIVFKVGVRTTFENKLLELEEIHDPSTAS